MNDGEKDPVRCRDLRIIERDIIDQLAKTQDEQRYEENIIQKRRPELSDMYSKLEQLQEDFATATALSALSRAVGSASGALTRISVQIQILKTEIKQLENVIDEAQSKLDNLRTRQRDLENSLKNNTQNMNSLNCVFD